ncbi:hypothetical protein ACFWM0_06695 [Streptomyces sp. NPDC058405]|uniref:hypothetical protein n=1 Tax=unclassified Streptomyces TaxID=2593676 RepID=UPI00364A67C7
MGKQGLEMHQRLDGSAKSGESGAEKTGRRLDLSVPQVAGSALAAVTAAVLASQLGVYGTMIGAGVVSVVATCGGSVFQFLFRRTGEQIRVVTVQAKPGGRQVPVRGRPGEPGSRDHAQPSDPRDPGDATWMLPQPEGLDGEFGDSTTHGTRVRGWKRPVLAAVAVFMVAMLGITGYELISGQELSGGRGTTVGSVVGGGGDRTVPSDDPANSPDPGGEQGQTPGGATPGDGGSAGPSGSPDGGPSTGTGPGDGSGASHSPGPSPSPSGGDGASRTPSPTPTPSESKGDGAGDSTGTGPGNSGAASQDTGSGSRSGSGTAGQ